MGSASLAGTGLNDGKICFLNPLSYRGLGLGKTVLHKICVSGTVLWYPTNANSPTYTYISQKPW